MSKEEDFACENFAPQKWRKDVCRNCYQMLRLHKKKEKKSTTDQSTSTTTSSAATKPGYVNELLQQDVNLVNEKKNQPVGSEKPLVSHVPSASKIPTKPSPPLATKPSPPPVTKSTPPPPATRPKPKPGQRTSSLKRNQLLPSISMDTNCDSNNHSTNDDTSLIQHDTDHVTVEPVMINESPSEKRINGTGDVSPQVPSITPVMATPTSSESDMPTCSTNIESISLTDNNSKESDLPQSDASTTVPESDTSKGEAILCESDMPKGDMVPCESDTPIGDVVPCESDTPKEDIIPCESDVNTHNVIPCQSDVNIGDIIPSPLDAPTTVMMTTQEEHQEVPSSPIRGSEPPSIFDPSSLNHLPYNTNIIESLSNNEQVTDDPVFPVSPSIPPPPGNTPTQIPPIPTAGSNQLGDIPVMPVYDRNNDNDNDNTANTNAAALIGHETGESDQSMGIPPVPSSVPSSLGPVPPPPPPLPPISSPASGQLPKVRVLSKNPKETPPRLTPPPSIDRGAVLEQIRSCPKLRSVPPPVERTPTEERVLDIQSELKQRVIKLRKKENETISGIIVEKRSIANGLCQQLVKYQGRKTYLHNLVDMLRRMDEFVKECNLSPEIMEKKMNWPLWLVEQLRNVIKLMGMLDNQIVEVEKLCFETMKTQQLNVEKVQRCITGVIFTVKNIKNDLSRETAYTTSLNVFPVDDIDVHRLLKRAVESVTPLLDKLYEKALYSHSMVSDPSVGKFDLNFRLQNSIRLLRMCCQMSDTLMTHLDVQRHPKYSEAMLKGTELDDHYKKQLKTLERVGEWDANQDDVELKPSYNKRSPSVIKEENSLLDSIIDVIKKGRSDEDVMNVAENLTEDVFLRAEVKLLKVALSSCQTKMIDSVMLLRNKILSDESKKTHNFDWIHEAVQKANHECLKHLITVCKIPINCQSADAGNSCLHIAGRRQDWSTMACLVQLGANPLLVNSSSRSAIQLLGLKCFPPQHFPQMKVRELPFSLFSYVNNPSLSDAKLVSNEGEEFYVHRLVLCGQSPVFRSMLESELWINDQQDGIKIPLPNINSRTVKLLLQYLYTGESTFPRDDLNSWIELLSAADEFLLEPLRLQCEKVLSENIDSEVVIPMLYGSHRCTAKKLLVNCCNYVLEHYDTITDPENEALLYILNNASDMMQTQQVKISLK